MDKKFSQCQLLLSQLRKHEDPENNLTVVLRNGRIRVPKLLFVLSGSTFMLPILQELDNDASLIIISEMSYETFASFIDLVIEGIANLQNRRSKVNLQQLSFLLFGMSWLEFNSEIYDEHEYENADVSDDEDVENEGRDGDTIDSFVSFKGNQNMCIYCGRLYFDKSTRVRHQKTCNKNPKRFKGYKCDLCGKILKTQIGLLTHQDSTHYQKNQSYNCEQCNKIFKHESSLKRHKKIHDKSNKKYKCDFCDYKNIRRDHIYRHQEKKHKIYNLDIESLKQQLQPHINYKCPQCSQKFTKTEAIKHLRLTNCNDVTCLYCDKVFAQKSHLKQHLKSVHGNK